ncbi:MAG: hypothetical protein AAFW87_13015, partial [Pseudomonadota bacterium]
RGKRSTSRARVDGISSNVKIESVVGDRETAESIIDAVAAKYFDNYSGITYVEPVEILRPHKFQV